MRLMTNVHLFFDHCMWAFTIKQTSLILIQYFNYYNLTNFIIVVTVYLMHIW